MWYKAEKNAELQGFVHLGGCKIFIPEVGKGAKLRASATLVVHGRKEYVLTATDAAERDGWLLALQHNARSPPKQGLEQDGSRDDEGEAVEVATKANKLTMRAQNFVAKRILTSDLGKKLLREFCLPGVRLGRVAN